MTTTSVLSTLLSNVGSIVSAVIGWVGDFLQMVTTSGNELLLIFLLLPLVGYGIHMLKMMIRL